MGGFEPAIPIHAIVMIFGFLLVRITIYLLFIGIKVLVDLNLFLR